MAAMRALVTGANGFLGLNLVEQLCADGWKVMGLCRPGASKAYLDQFPVEILEGDITDAAAISRVMPENVDAVFHTAAMTSVWSHHNDLQTEVNVEGTRNVARIALEKGVKRLVHTSTWNTYGTGQAEISEESIQLGGRSWVNYVRTKYLAEEEVRAAVRDGLFAIILNPGHLFGRYDRYNWSRMIRMVHDETLPGIPRARSYFCHAAAVARAHVSAVESGRCGENYLLPGVEASFREVVEIICELAGRPVPSRSLPTWLLKAKAHVQDWRAWLNGREPDFTPEGIELMLNDPKIMSNRAANELGYVCPPLRVMVTDAYDWMKKEGLLS